MRTLRNPFTRYKIKEGGRTHKKLLKQLGGYYEMKYTSEDGTIGRQCDYKGDHHRQLVCSPWETPTDHPLYNYFGDPTPDIDLL